MGGFGGRLCRWQSIEPGALKEWRIGTFKIIDTRVSFYSRGARLLPPGPESSFHTFEGGVQDFHMNYVLVLLGLLAVLWLFYNCII